MTPQPPITREEINLALTSAADQLSASAEGSARSMRHAISEVEPLLRAAANLFAPYTATPGQPDSAIFSERED